MGDYVLIKKIILGVVIMSMFLFASCEKKNVETNNQMVGEPWINSNIFQGLQQDYLPSIKDDFYTNVNLEWLKSVRPWKGYSRNMKLIENEFIVRDQCKQLLRNKNLKSHEAQLVQNYFDLFLDWNKRNQTGIQELQDNMKQVMEIKNIDDLSNYLTSQKKNFWSNGILNACVETSFNDADKYILTINIGEMFLSDSADYKKLSENGKQETELARKKIFYMLEQTGYADQKEKIFNNCFEYEKQLAEKIPTRQEQSDAEFYKKINNELDFNELKNIFSNFDISKFLSSKNFDLQEKYLVPFPQALKKINDLCVNQNLDLIKDYILAHMLVDCSSFLTEDIFRQMQKFDNEKLGIQESLSDEDLAFKSINSFLMSPMAKVYTENYCNEQQKQDIYKIIQEVIGYYKKMLAQNDWLSQQTIDKAVEKLENIKIFSVYPEKWRDYRSLNINKSDSYLEVLKKIDDFEFEYNKSLLGQKVEKDFWETCILTNAFYDPQKNSIYICAGFLGHDIYRLDMSQEEKYAAIGTVIGHEISHAFDTHGAQFDKDGNFKNWWTEKDYQAFNQRAQKLIDYYDGLKVLDNGEKYCGKLVQGEAIADMGGVKAMLGIASEKSGFNYDKFFRKYADIWKMIETREGIIARVACDPHPLCYLRVNVTLMQFDKFYETYKISSGNKMYMPKNKRIAVW